MIFNSITAGRYEAWQGLPPLTLEELENQLSPIVRASAPVERNRALYRYTVTTLERVSPPTKIEAWILAGTSNVFIVECGNPPPGDVENTLRAMAEPDLVLEDRLLRVSYLVDDFVYPHRGIALSIGRPLTRQAEPERTLLHVRLFPPMTRETYLTEVDDTSGLAPQTSP
jgi:hypothetical protein